MLSVVPGSTVDRTTTVCRRPPAQCAPIDSETRSSARQILPARARGRSPDADHREVGARKAECDIGRSRQPPGLHVLANELRETRLEDRRLPARDHLDLVGADVDADDVVTSLRRHAADTQPT